MQTGNMQTGLIALEIMALVNRVPMDTRALIREFAIDQGELSPALLLRILKQQGFRTKIKKIPTGKIDKLTKYPFPILSIQRDGTYTVITQKVHDQLIYFSPQEQQPRQMACADFEAMTTGQYIIAKHRAKSQDIQFGLKWFYFEILKYKKIMIEVLLGSFVIQLFGLVTPLFTQVILDKVVVHHTLSTLDVLTIAFAAIMILEFLLNMTRNYIFNHTANKIDAKLGAKLFKHLFALPFSYFESRKVGTIVSRVRELDNIRDFITNKSISLLIDTLFSVVFLGMMLVYNAQLTLMVAGFIVLLALLFLVVTPEFRHRLQNKFEMGSRTNSFLVETVTGIQTVKSLSVEGSMQQRWEDNLGSYLQSGFKMTNLNTVAKSISTLLQRGMSISILYFGVKLVIDNQMTIGQLIAFQMFANQFSGPVLRLVSMWNEFQQALLGVERLTDILNQPIELQSTSNITLPQLEGSVRLENVSFRYGLVGPSVLQNVNLTIPPGSCIGIVGRSGSGKSTITKLIQRLYTPHEGVIYIDEIDVRHMNPLWLRYHIGIVLQENYLFSGTIRDNIALPRPNATIEQIIQAAKMAGAHDFIKEFPEGYDTPVGERGSTLSGGQKQRIAIARALITNPKILIFDEATSALDYESERVILDNMRHIQKGRTTIVVTHRLSSVRHCDCIIAMDNGKIVEMGTHQSLIAQEGYYYTLVSQQDRKHAEALV